MTAPSDVALQPAAGHSAFGLTRPLGLASTGAFRSVMLAVALFTLALAVLAGWLFWQTNEAMTAQVMETVRAEAATLAAVGQAGGADVLAAAVEARGTAEPAGTSPGSGNGGGLYLLLDSTGARRAGNLSTVPPELRTSNPAAVSGGALFRYEVPGSGPRTAVAIFAPGPGGGWLVVGRDIEASRAFAKRLGWQLFGACTALALAGLAFAGLISRLVLGRIGEMTRAASAIMAGNLSERIPTGGAADELDELAASLNAMLARIESLMAGMREVSDNIAHDLKTPLNRLRHRAEAALRDGDASTHKRALEGVIEDADDLIKTFSALLLVARLEAGAIDDNAEVFALRDLVHDVAELYEPVADEAGVPITVAADGAPSIRANRQLIGQAVANLVDNALKYGASDGTGSGGISIAAARTAGGIEISVADRGAGIAAADRARVLQRFVRLDSARTKSGTGLGLNLVAAVARASGGTLRLEDNAPGLRVVMALPERIVAGAPAGRPAQCGPPAGWSASGKSVSDFPDTNDKTED